HSGFERSLKEWVNPFEDPIEQLPHILPVLEKTVQDEAKPGVHLNAVDPGAEQKIAHHEVRHAYERTGRGLELRQPLERGIPLAAELQDLTIEVLFARKMPEQEAFGNAGGFGQFPGRRAGKALSRKKRYRRRNDRFAAFVAIQSNCRHRTRK